MSEIMLGVLRMPDELFWNDCPIARMQHNRIRKEAADEIDRLRARLAELEGRARPFHDVDPNWLYSVIRYARKTCFDPDVAEGLREMDEDEAFLVPNLYAAPVPAIPSAESLAQFIRTIDGKHNMAADALAEHICGWLGKQVNAQGSQEQM